MGSPDSPAVTDLLTAWSKGDRAPLEQLVPIVHDELRRVAARSMAGERKQHTLQATALVNEVYLRLVQINRVGWRDRAHVFAMSPRLMRRVLVDHARARGYRKRGGGVDTMTSPRRRCCATGGWPRRGCCGK